MEKSKFTLPASERISGKKDIENLFAKGKSFMVFPLRTVYVLTVCEPADEGVSLFVGVSKRYFKRAVDRNRLKRLMRESYRLNKSIFATAAELKGCSLKIAFLYVHQEKSTYAKVEKSMKKAFDAILKAHPS
jgi:ribonuclease P protein component